MDEYIPRKALLDWVHEFYPEDKVFVSAIINAPAADVAPVVHGRWISKNPHGYEWTFVCSNCCYVDGYPFNDRHNYCPNCGAKMYGDNVV